MPETFRQYIDRISDAAEQVFKTVGRLTPCLFFINGDGQYVMVPAPSRDKDLSSAMFRALLELSGATRCVFCDEAWGVRSDNEKEARAIDSYARHNSLGIIPDREEVVIFMCEDAREGTIMARRPIIRPAKGKARLGPLEIQNTRLMEGRLVGMLPKPERDNRIMTDTAVTVAKNEGRHPLVVLRERLESRKDELRNSLPSDIHPDRFIRALVTAAQIDANLLACSFQSLWLACMRACRDGLLPDGREGAIVAYKEKAQWIPMYQGLLKKVAPNMKWVTAACVYEGEAFDHWVDENGEHLMHRPSDTFNDRAIVRVYAMGATKGGGGTYIAVLPLAEVNKIRKMSRASREDAPWNMWFTEMAKKTALRRLCKLLPIETPLPEDEELIEETPKPALTVAPRERGAAAALDLFAGSPEETSAQAEASTASGETGGGGQDHAGEAAARTAPQSTTAADVHDNTTNARQSAHVGANPAYPGGDPAQTRTDPPASDGITSAATAGDPGTTEDPLAIAHRRGQEAKKAGHQRKALPTEYRTPQRDEEAQAWLRGHDGKPL